MNTVKYDITKLEALRADLKRHAGARVKVGVLGDKAARSNMAGDPEHLSNPEIGLIHEFGSKGGSVTIPSGQSGPFAQKEVTVKTSPPIPARSFLRMPLLNYLPKEINVIGKAVWLALVQNKGLLHALGNLGLLATNVVQRAFETSGFGQWAPNAPMTIRLKGSSKPLIDTAQLRRSIIWRVEPGKGSE